MGKKKKFGGEDTRGLKAKAQKAASRAAKDAERRSRAEQAEAATWKDGVSDRKAQRRKEKEEKALLRKQRQEANRAVREAEEREMAGVRVKGKRRKAQIAAGDRWGGKSKGTNNEAVSMKARSERKIQVPEDFIRQIVSDFYAKNNPEKLANIDKIMQKFAGKWAKLENGLRRKFGEKAPDFEALYEEKLREDEKRRAAKMKGVVVVDDSSMMTNNINHAIRDEKESGVAVAFGVDDTLEQLSGLVRGGESKTDRNPERRRKAAYKAYEERELARLRQEQPGLKRSQYKERIFNAWKKSPENPMNQQPQRA